MIIINSLVVCGFLNFKRCMHEQTIASFAGPPFSDLCHIKEGNWRNEERKKEATKKKEINSMFPMHDQCWEVVRL